MLKPQYLFSLRSLQNIKKPKESFKVIQSKLTHIRKSTSLLENDTLNSTRSNTSHSRRPSDYEFAKSLSSIPKIRKTPELLFCKSCNKHVITHLKVSNANSFEAKITEFFNFFIACWEPFTIEENQVVDICEECGKEI